jgi:hypothetical protein
MVTAIAQRYRRATSAAHHAARAEKFKADAAQLRRTVRALRREVETVRKAAWRAASNETLRILYLGIGDINQANAILDEGRAIIRGERSSSLDLNVAEFLREANEEHRIEAGLPKRVTP